MEPRQVVDFYDRHPINEGQILDALARRGKDLSALTPEDLFDLDQDHYGGLQAVDALARLGGVGQNSRVLDLCCGLGGPARFLASRFGCRVAGVDLTHSRCASAARLTRLVGLSGRVSFVGGDAVRLPFKAGSFTACLSQEAFLHVPDKAGALAECARVLIPGGRLAFTDWVAGPKLSPGERRRLSEWMATAGVENFDGYRRLLSRVGFGAIEAEDLSDWWRRILRERLQMYRRLEAETVARFGQARYEEYDQLYAFFVGLVEASKLGGGRFSATLACPQMASTSKLHY
ncbi:MAG: methyltransferase domain-containing protein [Candidatus Rokubacteria bacterium]|nr:methyltransferase domain-containing protein [Candidatus Rokubacteria bacterium]